MHNSLFITLIIRSPVCTPARMAAPSVREMNYLKCHSFTITDNLLEKQCNKVKNMGFKVRKT